MFSVAAPKGENAKDLVELLEQISARWVRDGAIPPGERGWKYRNLHMALYALATAPDPVFSKLSPNEEGE